MSGQATLPDAFPPVKRAAEKRRAKAAHPGEKSRTKREQKVAAAGREVLMRAGQQPTSCCTEVCPYNVQMNVLSCSQTRARLKEVMDRVVEDHTPVVITRRNAEAVVLVSLADWNSMEATAHLLSTPTQQKASGECYSSAGGQALSPHGATVIARSEATKQSTRGSGFCGLLRCARNDAHLASSPYKSRQSGFIA
jgi:antitoxin YefM